MRTARFLLSTGLKIEGLAGPQTCVFGASSISNGSTHVGLQSWHPGFAHECAPALGCGSLPASSQSYSTKPASRYDKLRSQPEFPKARLDQFPGRARTLAEGGTEESMAKGLQRGRGINTGGLSYWAWKMENLAAIPILPKALGFAGALPFLFTCPTILKACDLQQYFDAAAHLQMHYAAVIISFLGAVHWGGAMASTLTGPAAAQVARRKYLWSVAPALAAVLALQALPDTGTIVMSFLLIACYLSDRGFAQGSSLPAWYMTLRGWLTVLAVMSLLNTTYYYANKAVEEDKEKSRESGIREAAAW